MAALVKKLREPFVLTARIGPNDISYHLAQNVDHGFSEILAFEMSAAIETIHPKFKRHLGKDLLISFTGSGRASRDDFRDEDENAIYLLDLRAESRYLSGVIPSDALWALPGLIEAGHISYLVVCFEPPRQGRGIVRSIEFVSEAKLADYRP
ncbi:hypothetical protein FHS52_000948 [Erythromicrobium ramosum]|uniref:Uncharacterized protein n=1 Tax=Erythrobacter ramosus TaxID=35811 RepID=A0A6I4UIN0_9SPHN|nr:hypothetical protein [Erythrobacter ramosus]MBB3775005.1 hypothetical protein [Erythrobacter ramosus]MXP37365.1 hypothetical protein [Erythrobacter ramosus]